MFTSEELDALMQRLDEEIINPGMGVEIPISMLLGYAKCALAARTGILEMKLVLRMIRLNRIGREDKC